MFQHNIQVHQPRLLEQRARWRRPRKQTKRFSRFCAQGNPHGAPGWPPGLAAGRANVRASARAQPMAAGDGQRETVQKDGPGPTHPRRQPAGGTPRSCGPSLGLGSGRGRGARTTWKIHRSGHTAAARALPRLRGRCFQRLGKPFTATRRSLPLLQVRHLTPR